MPITPINLLILTLAVTFSAFVGACSRPADAAGKPTTTTQSNQAPKKAVLLVNHGSHSERWRRALTDMEDNVREELLADGTITGLKTAFMEYTEPSIATQLKALDDEGFDEVVMVPIFLTVSSHSFDDIPTIIGERVDVSSKENLAAEGIECYTPKAKVTVAPLLDFAQVMRANLKRRVEALSKDPANEGIVLVAYGSTPYEAEWIEFMDTMRDGLRKSLSIDSLEFAWCGHIAHYSPEPTAEAIERVLAVKDKALVVPVLVAIDEDFQYAMILEAAKREYAGGTVSYIPDSILPEPLVEDWVLRISKELASR